MYDVALTDKDFDISQSSRYHLSIQASLNGFSFCVFDYAAKKYIALKHFQLDNDLDEDKYISRIEKILREEELLNTQYQKEKFIYISQKSTLIPSSLFDIQHIKLYFEFNQDLDELDELHFNVINTIQAHNIFAVPNCLANVLVDKYPGIKFFHHATPFLEYVLEDCKNFYGTRVYSNFHPESFHLGVVKNGKLILSNYFQFRHENDALFYVLNVYSRLKLDMDVISLTLSGFIDENSLVYIKLKEYLAAISFQKPDNDFTYDYSFSKVIAPHSFINLFSLYKCE